MAELKPETSNKGRAKALYENLVPDRQPFLERAIDSSRLTIPTLIPPLGHTKSTKFYTPYQSVGARGVNNLASKLLQTLLPSNTPCFRLEIDEFVLEKLGEDPSVQADVDSKLAKMERSVQNKIETEAIRVSAFEGIKHTLVAGNALLYMPLTGGMKVHHLHNYVLQRDPMDQLLDIVVKECASPAALSQEIQAMLGAADAEEGDGKDSREREKTVELYTHITWDNGKWRVYQEVCGMVIPSSRGTYPAGKSPWIPIRMCKVDGESYGRGYVEEYLGDLKSLEGLSQAIVEGAAAAAKILFLVNPNGTTSMQDLADTPSGGFAEGNHEDVTVLQLEKYGDFRVTMETATKIEERLSFAFMLNSAVQRSGERVTAEEIRFMAQELEAGLGGVYSILSQEFQLPLVNRLMFRMQRTKELPTLPKGIVNPVIVTGLDALGRGNDLTKLDTFMQAVMQVPQAAQAINWDNYMTRRATALGIDTAGLIKPPEQIAAEQQQAAQAQLAQNVAPNAVNAVGAAIKQGIANHGKSQSGQPQPAGA